MMTVTFINISSEFLLHLSCAILTIRMYGRTWNESSSVSLREEPINLCTYPSVIIENMVQYS
jgi:hypothetical protein